MKTQQFTGREVDDPKKGAERGGKTDKEHAKLLKTINEQYDADAFAEQDNVTEQRDDMRFRAGDQWPSTIIQERETDGRPCVTVDKTGSFVRQVTGNLRKNPPSLKVRPVGSGADARMARALGGLIRKIEKNSDAPAAYLGALDHAASGGIGHWRILTDYVQWDAFDQDISIELIADPFAVTWDRMATKATREDARHCFVSDWLTEDSYEAQFPDHAVSSFDDPIFSASMSQQWFMDKAIRIAEYWWKEEEEALLALLQDGKVLDVTKLGERELQQLPIIKFREAKVDCVWWCKTNGTDILEKPRKWMGRYIPIVPVLGEEIHTGDKIKRKGLVRDIKDAQRLYNYARSAQAEVIALQPKAPFVGTKKQLQMHWEMWKNANKKNYPALVYDADPAAPGPPQRVSPPIASQALSEMVAQSSEDMKATTGIFDASLGARSNETSGVAIRARQEEGDTGTAIYGDNLGRSMMYSGKIILDLIPKVYDTERSTRILHDDDTDEEVTFNQTIMVGGEAVTLYDVTMGKYDVEMTIGPTYATRRAEAKEGMLEFIRVYPEAGPLAGDLIAKNSDWPGADIIARRLRRMMPPQLLEGEKSEDDEMQQPVQIGPDGQPIPGPQAGPPGALPPGGAGPAGVAPQTAGQGPEPETGPHDKDMALADAKMGIEAQKVDNEHDYKQGMLEIERGKLAIARFNANLTAKTAHHEEMLAQREADRAMVEALNGGVEGAEPSGAEPAADIAPPQIDETGAEVPLQAPTQQPVRLTDLVNTVNGTVQAIAMLADQIAKVQQIAMAPKRIDIARDAVGRIAHVVQTPMIDDQALEQTEIMQ